MTAAQDWARPFVTDDAMRYAAGAALRAAFVGHETTRPALDTVITDAVRVAVTELFAAADALGDCVGVDDCQAQAEVLRHLAQRLEDGVK